jgi:hypothetical protein
VHHNHKGRRGENHCGQVPKYTNMRSIMIINPNSTEAMTDGLKPLVDGLQFTNVKPRRSLLSYSD